MSTIAFARGVPSPDILPVAELADCAKYVIESDGTRVLNYGHSFGYPPLREWLAEQHGVTPERVALTVGALGGFNVLARQLFEQRPVEAPLHRLHALRRQGRQLPCKRQRHLQFLAGSSEAVRQTDAQRCNREW